MGKKADGYIDLEMVIVALRSPTANGADGKITNGTIGRTMRKHLINQSLLMFGT